MTKAFFVSDLHGRIGRYESLFAEIREKKPGIVFFGGDLLHIGFAKPGIEDFVRDYLMTEFQGLKNHLQDKYPKVFLILGNDDPRILEDEFLEGEKMGLWEYIHNKKVDWKGFSIYGYAYVPPTPFRLKDWERYDVSRYVDPGCVPPTEGFRTVDTGEDHEYETISNDLTNLVKEDNLSNSVFLFHSPPYQTNLDRAALDHVKIEHIPLDVHVGSIAIKRFIEEKQPKISLHGHIHESSNLTGKWHDKIGETYLFSAAWHNPELALVEFELEEPGLAIRRII